MQSITSKAVVFLLVSALLAGCGGSQQTASTTVPSVQSPLKLPKDGFSGPGTKLKVMLGDSAPNLGPGYQLAHLYIGVDEIDALANNQTTVLASYSTPDVVDVLQYQDNNGLAVANGAVAGTYVQQMKLVIDESSSKAVFTNGMTMPLTFPLNTGSNSTVSAGETTWTVGYSSSAVQSILTYAFTIPGTDSQAVRLDFNAFESLELGPNNTVTARPALFVSPTQGLGSVTGTVTNASGSPVSNATVVAVASDGSIGNTTATDSTGSFTMGTLYAGTYQLQVYNTYTTAVGRNVQASGETSSGSPVNGPQITISGGQTTSAGTISD